MSTTSLRFPAKSMLESGDVKKPASLQSASRTSLNPSGSDGSLRSKLGGVDGSTDGKKISGRYEGGQV